MASVQYPLMGVEGEKARTEQLPAMSSVRKRCALVVLSFIYGLSFADRALLGMLLQSIKEDLRLSDSQLGFLSGTASGLFFAILGVSVARWADRGNRVTIASVGIALWGCTVMASAWVGSYVQMIVARVAASIGEAGGGPPTYSLLGDYFPQAAERTRAMYAYQAAGPIAITIGLTFAGWVNEVYGWRQTFVVMGAVGLCLALIAKLTLKEPRISKASLSGSARSSVPSFRSILVVVWGQKACRHLMFASIVLTTMVAGTSPWLSSFMVRSHGMETAELGMWIGFGYGLSGLAGLLLGAYVVNRWFVTSEKKQLRLAALGVVCSLPLMITFLTVPEKHEALGAFVLQTVTLNAFLPPVLALLQRLIPDDMRATVMAMITMVATIVGMAVGPQLVGTLSDLLKPALGPDALRYAMMIVSCLALWGACHLWVSSRAIEHDLSRVSIWKRASRRYVRAQGAVSTLSRARQ